MEGITNSTLIAFGVSFSALFIYLSSMYIKDEKSGEQAVEWNSAIWQVSFSISFMVISFIFFTYTKLYSWLVISFIPYLLLLLNERRIEKEFIELDKLEEKYREMRIEAQKKMLNSKLEIREKEELEELIRTGKYVPDSNGRADDKHSNDKRSFLKRRKSRKRKHIPNSLQDRIWRRDRNRCVDCGSKEFIEIDHIVPHSKGGKDTYRNLQLLCQDCNRKKADKMI